jgi:hypothetical protein
MPRVVVKIYMMLKLRALQTFHYLQRMQLIQYPTPSSANVRKSYILVK